MSAFLTPLWLEDIDGDNWCICASFVYQSDLLRGIVTIDAGTFTDLASIPKLLRGIAPKSGKYNKGAVLHDAGYNGYLKTIKGQRINLIKPLCDKLFLEAMEVSGVNRVQRKIMYQLVAKFGKKS